MSVEFIIVEVSIKTCTTEGARHCNIKPQGREARFNVTHINLTGATAFRVGRNYKSRFFVNRSQFSMVANKQEIETRHLFRDSL